MIAQPYTPADEPEWEALVASAPNGTFLLSRLFLGYHGDRFLDRSLVFRQELGAPVVGVLPAAEHPADTSVVVSHPGLSYGGLVHADATYGDDVYEMLKAARSHYASAGYKRLVYKLLPSFYQAYPQRDDAHALHRAGARLTRVDLSATIALAHRGRVSTRRKRGQKKAMNCGVEVRMGSAALAEFHAVLSENLGRRHGASPVHTVAEMQDLMARFADQIELVTAHQEESLVAGVWLFKDRGVHHAQYIAASSQGHEMGALDLLFDALIARATETQQRVFDFGISTEDEGHSLNAGLYRFKRQFGAGSTLHQFYDLVL